MRKLIKKDKYEAPAQISSITTNEATGIDFITSISGEKRSFIKENLCEIPPDKIPSKRARLKPNDILNSVDKIDIQKFCFVM